MTTAPDAPLWRIFDAAWYRQEYKDVIGADLLQASDDALEEWYVKHGAPSGHSPNPFFDEEWYRLSCSEAQQALMKQDILSGFEHYCSHGYKTQSPHYLFSERDYSRRYPHLSPEALEAAGYMNGYDHYIRTGDHEHLSGNIFFNPALYIKNSGSPDEAQPTPFRHFILNDKKFSDEIMISENFDPIWYAQINADAVKMVSFGFMPNLLYCFLSKSAPNTL